METYARIGEAAFADAHLAGVELKTAVDAFLAKPDAATLAAARDAWKAARPWYQQTEVFRFGNPVVDEWEGRVNAWPLDEGLIDYVDAASYGESSDENALFRANIVANAKIRVGKDVIDASVITPDLLSSLQEAGGVEANVAIGYHAVEFLLWGQDLQHDAPGAGTRPATDYDLSACTNGHCDRRRDYLRSATDLLVADLAEMAESWKPGGAAREDLRKAGAEAVLTRIVTGIGSLSYGELGGERMKLGLILKDPEEEHDCFSDNTQNSHHFDQVGMMNVFHGSYVRRDGSKVEGASLRDFLMSRDKAATERVEADMRTTLAALDAIRTTAESGKMAYDQMISEGNPDGNALIQAGVDALVAQTRSLEAAAAKAGVAIKIEGSASLDDPSSVQ
ncbi:MAG: imelysin family protein [Labrys sp. (in: a-proteobacteria)]